MWKILPLLFILVGCGTEVIPTVEKAYHEGKDKEAQQFILKCIESAAGEDSVSNYVISKCEELALGFFGTKTQGFIIKEKCSGKVVKQFTPCMYAETDREKEACQ